MKVIESYSQEHKELLFDALANKKEHVLQQMKAAFTAESKRLIVLNSFSELLMYSTCDDDPEQAEVLTDAALYTALNLDDNGKRQIDG